MQEQISQMQSKLKTLEVEGSSGNGLVRIILTGDTTLKQIYIKPECVDKDDIDGLQDLIKLAYQDAKKKLDEQSMQGMPSMPGLF